MMGAETLRGGRSRVAIGIKGYDLVAVLVHGAGDLGGDGEEVRNPDRVKVPQLQLRTMVIRDECAAAAAAAAAATQGESRAIT